LIFIAGRGRESVCRLLLVSEDAELIVFASAEAVKAPKSTLNTLACAAAGRRTPNIRRSEIKVTAFTALTPLYFPRIGRLLALEADLASRSG